MQTLRERKANMFSKAQFTPVNEHLEKVFYTTTAQHVGCVKRSEKFDFNRVYHLYPNRTQVIILQRV